MDSLCLYCDPCSLSIAVDHLPAPASPPDDTPTPSVPMNLETDLSPTPPHRPIRSTCPHVRPRPISHRRPPSPPTTTTATPPPFPPPPPRSSSSPRSSPLPHPPSRSSSSSSSSVAVLAPLSPSP